MKFLLCMRLVLVALLLPVNVYAQDTGLTKQFSECMDKSNGVTSNMIECFVTESKRQDIRINNAYKELMNQVSPQRKKQLETAQDAWITYRDENCEFYYDPDGGTIARLSANDCFVSATATRAKELESLAGGPQMTVLPKNK